MEFPLEETILSRNMSIKSSLDLPERMVRQQGLINRILQKNKEDIRSLPHQLNIECLKLNHLICKTKQSFIGLLFSVMHQFFLIVFMPTSNDDSWENTNSMVSLIHLFLWCFLVNEASSSLRLLSLHSHLIRHMPRNLLLIFFHRYTRMTKTV